MTKEPQLLAYSAVMNINKNESIDVENWFETAIGYFDGLVKKFKKPGATIGHIKGFLELENGAFAYLSNVGNSSGTMSKADGKGYAKNGKLDYNVLLYGWTFAEVDTIVKEQMAIIASQFSCHCQIKVGNNA